mgnify:CR=1 FL=1
MIEIKHLSKRFATAGGDIDALKDISLTIPDGEIYGIIGMSGAGKSTLVRCINMLERPTEGEVVIDGKNIATLSQKQLREERRHITMIFQGFNLLMQRNCLKNVCFPLELAGVKKAEAEARAKELLELVGLGDKLKNKPNQLSGGQQQRVSIARALVRNPAIILADEPTGALDSHTGREVLGMLQDLHGQGHTVVLITHDNSIAVQADRIIRLEDGQVVYDGDSRAPEAIVQPTLNFEPAEQEGNK